MMSSPIQEYIDLVNSHLLSLEKEDEVHLTVGNESCDLDSIVSALCHGYYSTQQNPSQSPCLPVLQCSQSDFALRTDVAWLFSQLQLDSTKLLYLEDIIEELKKMNRVFVTLVDHHTLTGPLVELTSLQVVSVIDHHHPPPSSFPSGPGPYLVEPVGSCATLVAEILLENNCIHSSAATLLLGAILLDTVGLDKSTGRVSDKDIMVAERLKSLVDVPPDELYRNLSSARLSTTDLTSLQLLRKDMKCVETGTQRIGFSSVTCQLSTDLLETRQDSQEAVESIINSHSLSVLIILGLSVGEEGVVSREIAIFQRDQSSDVADAIASVLESDQELRCRRCSYSSCILLEQSNSSLSRKYVLPLITNFLSSVDDGTTTSDSDDVVSQQPPDHSQRKAEREAEKIPEYTYKEEVEEIRSHRVVDVEDDSPAVVDMNIVTPYKKIIQHGGYVGPERQALLVISACYLPPRSLPDYDSTANQLFLYVISVVQRLVVDDYQIIYLHSGAPQHSMPSISILKRFYQLLDHRLRKQLKHLYVVHPSFWVRSMLQLARPFISTKFYRKVHLIRRLEQLPVTLEQSLIPAPVLRRDPPHPHRPSQPPLRYTPTTDQDTAESAPHTS